MNVEVETSVHDSSFGIPIKGTTLTLKDVDRTIIYSHPVGGNPYHKFFNRNGVSWVVLGGDFSAEIAFINTSTREVHVTSYYEGSPVLSEIFPSPDGRWMAGVEQGYMCFYTLDESIKMKFIQSDDEDYMNDEFPLDVDGNETFGWIDVNHFSFKRHGQYKVVFEFLDDGQILIPVKEKLSVQS